MDIVLKEVLSRKELDVFIAFPDNLYNGCRYYVPALYRQQVSTLSKENNPAFSHCEARYWLAYSGETVVGRIAGIINHLYNQERSAKYMRFGWLDFTEDERVLNLLMGAVESWAREKDLEVIHGPLGFTSFDASGVLVEGFNEWPTAFGHYNYAYYDRMLIDAGFSKDVDWVEKSIKVPRQRPERETKILQMVKARYSLRNARLRNSEDIRKYAGYVFELINTVYKDLYGFSTLSPGQIEDLTSGFLPLISKDYMSVILNDRDEMVAFGLVMPSLAKAIKKAKGRLSFFGRMHIFWALNFNDTVDMLLIGVKPEYQNKGAHSLIFEKIFNTLKRKGIKQVETTRELEGNEKIQQLWNGYELRQHKRARCYIKPVQIA